MSDDGDETDLSSETKLEAEVPKLAVPAPSSIIDEITKSILSTQEENQQVLELIEMEKSYSSDLVSQLKQIIGALNESFHINPQSVSANDASITDVVLTPQGAILVFRNNGTVITRPLELLPGEAIVKILGELIPSFVNLMKKKRSSLSTRVLSLEKLAKEMRRLQSSPKPKQQQATA